MCKVETRYDLGIGRPKYGELVERLGGLFNGEYVIIALFYCPVDTGIAFVARDGIQETSGDGDCDV
jgi:hypothetical protein